MRYYCNMVTMETTWEKPTVPAVTEFSALDEGGSAEAKAQLSAENQRMQELMASLGDHSGRGSDGWQLSPRKHRSEPRASQEFL